MTMKEEYSYLLKTNQEITAHLESIKADNFHKKVDEDLHNLCFEAAQGGNVELMNRIISRHPNITEHINTQRDSYDYTILQVASWYNHPEIVDLLIQNGADDRREGENMTALELICLKTENTLNEATKKIIKSLLKLSNPTEIDIFLNFLLTSQETYPGVYEEISPLVEEFRAQQQPSNDDRKMGADEEELDILCKKDLSDKATIESIQELLENMDEEEVDEYLASIIEISPEVYNILFNIVIDFRFIQAINQLEEVTSVPSSEENITSLFIINPNNIQAPSNSTLEERHAEEIASDTEDEQPTKNPRIGTPELYQQLYGDSSFIPPINQSQSFELNPEIDLPSIVGGTNHDYLDLSSS